ncbi:hypothetical protein S2M10_11880 [Sphingomonas sp. S2M10]|uniref:type II toxin-antitoxin system HicB family antitoxin n=1 Tax=Sphingomonas sp. S2M10 TaxID=2705010 RepID=UPI0014573611|nr:type II toxin-antitoxin system HicB family antitoxin [Sphingomonas sp. S2M10]NLS26207.1 hypothetical protein [Sphingomonas sp. S2M10]
MKIYFGLVHKDEGSAYGLSFPDLPGCFSAAGTVEDLVKSAVAALELWFEDADEAEPGDVTKISDAYAHDLANGAFLLAIPYVEKAGKRIAEIRGEVRSAVRPNEGRFRL